MTQFPTLSPNQASSVSQQVPSTQYAPSYAPPSYGGVPQVVPPVVVTPALNSRFAQMDDLTQSEQQAANTRVIEGTGNEFLPCPGLEELHSLRIGSMVIPPSELRRYPVAVLGDNTMVHEAVNEPLVALQRRSDGVLSLVRAKISNWGIWPVGVKVYVTGKWESETVRDSGARLMYQPEDAAAHFDNSAPFASDEAFAARAQAFEKAHGINYVTGEHVAGEAATIADLPHLDPQVQASVEGVPASTVVMENIAQNAVTATSAATTETVLDFGGLPPALIEALSRAFPGGPTEIVEASNNRLREVEGVNNRNVGEVRAVFERLAATQ